MAAATLLNLFAMASVSAAGTGQPVWLDLLTDKPEMAIRFYQEVFGWQFEAGPKGYSTITSGDRPMGGVMGTDADSRVGESLWLVSVTVDDIGPAIQLVSQQGGVVLDGPGVNALGQPYVVVADPQGAALVLVSDAEADLDDAELVSNGWAWLELWAQDVPAATEFYSSLAAYQVERLVRPADDPYNVLKVAGQAQLGIVSSPWQGMQANWLPYILVEDVGAVIADVEAASGKVILPPLPDYDDGRVAILADPTGGVFAIQQSGAAK